MRAVDERERTAAEIEALSRQLRPRDVAVAVLFERLAEAVRQRQHDETRGYAGAIDPRAVAELLVARPSTIWSVLEVARNVLVFAPIAVTWYGLSVATEAYGRLIAERPDLVTRPFLLLWQDAFGGASGVINFSTLAFIDAGLIGVLIALSLAIHVRADLRDVAVRTRVLLQESQIRSLIGHATSLTSKTAFDEAGSERLLDEMVAEERRIYERAMEREQRLFDLEGAIGELRAAAAQLASAARTLSRRKRTGEDAAERPLTAPRQRR